MLDVGDGNRIAWELSGIRRGKPAVVIVDAGHTGDDRAITSELIRATDRFADRR
jgi:hypothetical protein